MSDLFSEGDWVDYKGEKYLLQMKGSHGEHIIVREGDLKVVDNSELSRWENKQIEEV